MRIMKSNILISMATMIMVVVSSAVAQSQVETIRAKISNLQARPDSLNALFNEFLQATTVIDSPRVQFGITGPAGTLMDKQYFVIKHNDSWKIPYWVAYYLSDSSLQGTQDRTGDFRADAELLVGARAELTDYQGSKFDRGHNAPAAAFKRNREAMSATFLLSNMCPQTPQLNQQIWRILEDQVRDMVLEKGEGWIFTDSICMSPDSQLVECDSFIGTNRVAVPTHCFKAILLRDAEGNYSMYAFLMPNARERIPGKPTKYLIKVDRLEEITGYDFFPGLNDNIENILEGLVPSTWP